MKLLLLLISTVLSASSGIDNNIPLTEEDLIPLKIMGAWLIGPVIFMLWKIHKN